MGATFIDGEAIALRVRREVAEATRELKARTGHVPRLAVIRVGEESDKQDLRDREAEGRRRGRLRGQRAPLPRDRQPRRGPVPARGARRRSGSAPGWWSSCPSRSRWTGPRCSKSHARTRTPTGCTRSTRAARPQGRDAASYCCPWGVMRMLQEMDLQTRGQARGGGGPEHPGGTADGPAAAERRRDGDRVPPEEQPAGGGRPGRHPGRGGRHPGADQGSLGSSPGRWSSTWAWTVFPPASSSEIGVRRGRRARLRITPRCRAESAR